MKRILSTLLILTIVMAATAAELWVAGEKLDLSKTYSQVYLDALSGGYFDYYPSAKRLILTGVTIERSGDGKNGIDSSVAGLTIEFAGINSIKTSAACLKLQSNTTIVNDGTVNLTCTGSNEGIYIMNSSTVTIKGGIWKIQASSGTGIEGKDKNQEVYIYDNEYCPLYLTVNGKNGCILDLKYLWVGKGIDVCEPVRDKLNQNYIESFNTGVKRFTTALYNVGTTNVIKNKDVVIGTPAFELGGHGFTTNTTSISASTITGVTYINSTKTLKMSNASTTEGYFRPYLDDMTIELNRTNTLNYYGDHSSISSGKKLTIKGNGTLNTGPIYVVGSLDIKGGATVNITNNKNTEPGIEGTGVVRVDASTSNTTLNIDVKPEAVCCSAKIELIGSVIGSPSNAILANKTEAGGYIFFTVNKDGESSYIIDKDLFAIKDQLSIVKGTAYDLWVGGVRVNSANKDNLNNGYCSYNTSTKTLQLNNAKILLTNLYFTGEAIDNGINGLTIQNKGTSELSSSQSYGISSNKTFTIKGGGHLKVTGGSDDSAIYYDGSTDDIMTISDIELTATGGQYAILGETNINSMRVSVVDVINSTLHLYGSTRAIDVTSFDPHGNCYITTPSGGINTKTTITNASGTPAKKVEIEPKNGISTAIDAVAPIEESSETSIYTPSGILVWKGAGQPQLPSGIYMMKKGGKTKKVQF